jgi:hypothetical protein
MGIGEAFLLISVGFFLVGLIVLKRSALADETIQHQARQQLLERLAENLESERVRLYQYNQSLRN